MNMQDITLRVKDIVSPVVEDAGLDLVELNVVMRNREAMVQVLTDRPLGGITIDECSDINRKVSDLMEQEDIFPGHYVVEVSSPGLDRPLKAKKDFLRVIGKEVAVLLLEAQEGKGEFSGILKESMDDAIVLEVDAKQIQIPFANIQKALQVI